MPSNSDGRAGHQPTLSGPSRPTPVGACPDPDSDTARAVERALGLYLEERLLEAEAIDTQFAKDVAERVRSLALRGGKRLRAQFAWWGWRASGGDVAGPGMQSALRLGAALELIQTCALIHDDVMDGSSLRRGAPSLHVDFATDHMRSGLRGDHVAHGRASAILAGDLALAWADDLVADIEADTPTRKRILALWRSMRAEMVAGQYLDMYAQADSSSSQDRALHIALLKTSLYTVERPLALGAVLGGADEGTISALRSAGRSAGIAFQLRDDLLGVFGDPSETGKPVGEDIRSGKLTYLTATARSLSESTGDANSRSALSRAIGNPEISDADLNRLREILERTGAQGRTEAEIYRLLSHSEEELFRASLPSLVSRHLSTLMGISKRTSRTATTSPMEQHSSAK
ncbi:polyprenyl synthetase family protein [Streptomyces sp. CS7]|uniref:polyprenyl synthetase family protein n=1 Tax=Streptomyces sp. CS-7 TaxID=2906769 RepID=UPI0021B3914A|nr:polyprenyl synthetase family protein [Streptomyces sp. CS-7]MCT6782280.1 polyprenyl synthetase family protein [Streptomyces sp. CS-7]